jgi:hypothetical protein
MAPPGLIMLSAPSARNAAPMLTSKYAHYDLQTDDGGAQQRGLALRGGRGGRLQPPHGRPTCHRADQGVWVHGRACVLLCVCGPISAWLWTTCARHETRRLCPVSAYAHHPLLPLQFRPAASPFNSSYLDTGNSSVVFCLLNMREPYVFRLVRGGLQTPVRGFSHTCVYRGASLYAMPCSEDVLMYHLS